MTTVFSSPRDWTLYREHIARLEDFALPSQPAAFSPWLLPAYSDCFAAMGAHPINYAPATVWAWAETLQIDVRFAGGLAWLRCNLQDGTHALAPVGPWQEADWKAMEPDLIETGRFENVPETLLRQWQTALSCRIDFEESRDNWEYLYNAGELAAYSGSAYRMQRNNAHAYVREHGAPDVRFLGPADIPAMMSLSRRWLDGGGERSEHEPELTRNNEVDSMRRVLALWEQFSLVALGLWLNGELIAFDLGVRLDDGVMGVLYEKASPGVRGAFQVMVQAFASAMGGEYPLLNRAEDMGMEGLRFSKTMYRPTGFEKMYAVSLGAC
ncbi:MAG: phosphatidylglycerol lysyltransferase domain-containing protein [Desulfovibrionaceae bacterium]|nr:phosphatidylglycerol lysyltransferase domain-containing protein [Desulfovibrionaceae bacterium]